MAEVYGPYDSEEQTWSEPMPLTIGTLRDSGRIKSGDPDGISRNIRVEALNVAIDDAGVELGAFDERIVRWLGMWEPSTVQVLIGIISRAGARG